MPFSETRVARTNKNDLGFFLYCENLVLRIYILYDKISLVKIECILHLQMILIIDFSTTLHYIKLVVNLHLYTIRLSYLLLVTEIVS